MPSICILTLLFGLYFTINPLAHRYPASQVYADWVPATPGDNNTTDTSNLSLIITNPSDPATPANVGEVAYRSSTFTVTAKNYNYYSVTLSAMKGFSSELRGKNNPFATVEGVGYNVAPSSFKDNTWGYAVTNNTSSSESSLTYNTAPEYGQNAYVAVNKPLSGTVTQDYKITFAAKFGADMPSDNYQSQLLLSVVGSADKVVFDGIKYMQEMNNLICSHAEINDTTQLIDKRDNKPYWVAKLTDGNCWMTQNLDLDLNTAKPLTPQDSAVSSTWIPTTNTLTGNLSSDTWTGDNNLDLSWNPGNYYYIPETTSWIACDRAHNLDSCVSWSTTTNNNTHYHVGNYYSWAAATAGADNSINSGEAPNSICPKGWQLATRSIYPKLFEALNITKDNVNETIRVAPVYFTPGGYISAGWIQYLNARGYYWTSTPHSNGYAGIAMYFYNNNLPYIGTSRMSGMPIRCVAS